MSLTEKRINQDNTVVDGAQSEDHSLLISMENLRLIDDHGNHNKDQMDYIDVSQILKPKVISNTGYIFWNRKCRFIIAEMLK